MRAPLYAALPLLAALVAATPAPDSSAQGPPDHDVSRTPDGSAVLHRRVPWRGDGGDAEAAPIFVYDPLSGGSLPQEINREGRSLPRPGDGEDGGEDALYSRAGVSAAAPAPEAAAPPAGSPSGPGAPASALGGDAAAFMDNPWLGITPATPAPGGSSAPGPAPAPAGAGDAPAGAASAVPDPRASLGDIARPDRRTERESTLEYRTVFDPSVVPFKRNRALNHVEGDATLTLARGRYRRLSVVGNRLDPGREAFWGSVVLEARQGERVPLPSVAPDSRFLSAQATPEVGLVFERDDADNVYVTTSRTGRFRLVFVMDAPTSYFGRELPRGLSVRDVPPALRPRVPRGLARDAREVAAAIGISGATPYDALLDALVGYFRGFEPGEPPPAQGASIYKELALGRRGICRHRGHGFVVTAQALGVPARYVFNEAHVFVEVYVPGPDAGWLRVDLGGGADRLVVHGSRDKTLHQPRVRDPFARPERFAEAAGGGHSAGATRVEGLPSATPRGRPTGSSPDALQRHNCHRACFLGDAGMFRRDDVHNDAALEHLGESFLHSSAAHFTTAVNVSIFLHIESPGRSAHQLKPSFNEFITVATISF